MKKRKGLEVDSWCGKATLLSRGESIAFSGNERDLDGDNDLRRSATGGKRNRRGTDS